ncbi:hypothetical protein FS749_006187 [Ceratobasidium sp. UAMH 11750]|nr:hypothetical protein FS749_006187 [Ceratobasidium sp. UAMH 11750]
MMKKASSAARLTAGMSRRRVSANRERDQVKSQKILPTTEDQQHHRAWTDAQNRAFSRTRSSSRMKYYAKYRLLCFVPEPLAEYFHPWFPRTTRIETRGRPARPECLCSARPAYGWGGRWE